MDPAFAEFLKVLQSGGNVALIAAAWMLWRAVQSLTRIETFMSTLFEVLLRSDGTKINPDDMERLRVLRADMTRHRQGGFVMVKWIAILAGALALATFAVTASAQVASDAARVSWTNATQDVNGGALALCPDTGTKPAGCLIGTRVQRGNAANCAATFGAVAETINVPHAVTSVLFENLAPGTWCFRVRHTANNPAPDDVSAWTATVTKIIVRPVGKPERPVSITVE